MEIQFPMEGIYTLFNRPDSFLEYDFITDLGNYDLIVTTMKTPRSGILYVFINQIGVCQIDCHREESTDEEIKQTEKDYPFITKTPIIITKRLNDIKFSCQSQEPNAHIYVTLCNMCIQRRN